MNKKIVTLILVILISFCFLSVVIADNNTSDDNNATDDDNTIDENKTIDGDSDVDKNTTDKDQTTDKNKTDDKSKKNYILAKGKGNDIKFSDGFRGFILDYSKSSAISGDEFKHISTSKLSNSNTLKLAIIECYKQNSTDNIEKIISDFVKTGSSKTQIGEAVSDSHEKVSDHEVVKINNHTEAIFEFEVLKSASDNKTDYFAYKVSFKTIDDSEKNINQSNNLTNLTNTTNMTNTTNTTNMTNITNITNMTNLTQSIDNETNTTFLTDLYDYLLFLANALYDAGQPIINTLLNDILMIIHALEELANLYENIMMELQSLMDALGELSKMLESIWKELDGLLKLFGVLLTALNQVLNLIGSLVNFIGGLVSSIISLIQTIISFVSGLISAISSIIQSIISLIGGLISAIISLIQQLLGLLSGLIDFILNIINQILSSIQAILDFLKSVGSSFSKVIENAAIIIIAFVIIAVGAFVYNKRR